jgi:hypothetical protein
LNARTTPGLAPQGPRERGNDSLAAVRDEHPRTSHVGFPAYDIKYLEKQDGQHFAFHSTVVEKPEKGLPLTRAWRCAVTFEDGYATAYELSFPDQKP